MTTETIKITFGGETEVATSVGTVRAVKRHGERVGALTLTESTSSAWGLDGDADVEYESEREARVASYPEIRAAAAKLGLRSVKVYAHEDHGGHLVVTVEDC